MQPDNVVPQTPQEQVVYAGFWRRLGAILVDGLILLSVSFIMSVFFGGVSTTSSSVGYGLTGIPALIFNGLVIFYYVFFVGKFGQTLGKMALKIKIVKIGTNEAPGYLKAFLREFVGRLLSFLVLFIGYFWMLWDPQKQTWHDKIAGTVVVKV